ncbi:hypothetical protein NIIDMKKI_69920 [Mycobacterium kansasii]|uniref:Uncharacterized protein n=1 Tax=Mycobacterium kansasii TaxID=1768 RepID=A0A7G1ILA1_MYCKA|nr:hypothetical protein NIIDMKKI_69920 [Mycobacterium kansasii]
MQVSDTTNALTEPTVTAPSQQPSFTTAAPGTGYAADGNVIDQQVRASRVTNSRERAGMFVDTDLLHSGATSPTKRAGMPGKGPIS